MDSQTSIASDQAFANQFNKGHSRRSVDWRDSGIVIDEDQHFYSFDNASRDLGLPINLPASNPNKESQEQSSRDQHQNASLLDIKYNSALDHDDDGDTILHLAVVGCTVRKVKDLIRVCDLNAINNMMQTPLHVAVMASRAEMVELLITSGAKLDVHDRRGNTPLHLACQNGHKDIVVLILDSLPKHNQTTDDKPNLQQQINTTNFDGLTCLHLCALEDKRDIIKLLVNYYDADLNCQDSRSGETIVHIAINKFNHDLVAFILSLDKHCNYPDYSGRRPLDTIKILKNSCNNPCQLKTLSQIEQSVLNRIKTCVEQNNGCCFLEQLERLNNPILDSSSSSSDYSDSDFEMS